MPYLLANQIAIEKTPSYFTSKNVPKLIHNMNPKIKLILVVKNPVERTISDYAQILYNGKVKFNPNRYDGSSRKFEGNILNGHELISDPYMVVRKVESFLNLSKFITTDRFEYNEKKGFMCIKKIVVNRLDCLDDSKGRERPFIEPRVIDKLQAFYKPYNKEFFKKINQKPFR